MATARPARPKANTKTKPKARAPEERPRSVADLLHRLGNIPARRVRLDPPPGTATEKDLLRLLEATNKVICELVDGTLVEKPMGYDESELTLLLGTALNIFIRPRKLGRLAGADGALRLFPGLIRVPDLSFISYDRLSGRKKSGVPIPDLAPDLAVEVLSKSNTKAEMARKLREYFKAGTRLAWIVDPKTKTVRVHTSPEEFVVLKADQTLDGGAALPGFRMPLQGLFAALDE
jgi:Uma2 family endonuclease